MSGALGVGVRRNASPTDAVRVDVAGLLEEVNMGRSNYHLLR